jgi:hypothetical protein
MIQDELYKWSEKNVNIVDNRPVCYELYDGSQTLIYIGSTGNLSERFLDLPRYCCR